MVRTINMEDRIKRAEEISKRRNMQGETTYEKTKGENVKKEAKLLRKIFIQLIICLCIYMVINNIYNSQYVFTNDFINQIKGVLSYDTNFYDIYDNSKNWIINFFVEDLEDIPDENNELEENIDQEITTDNGNIESIETVIVENSKDAIGGMENVSEQNEIIQDEAITETIEEVILSQYEQDILTAQNTTTFIKPLNGVITSVFGFRETTNPIIPENHTGTDIAGNSGEKIIASTSGEVVLASSEGGYGNHLKIQIGDVSVIYAHCSELLVKQGDYIVQGQEIATVGSTGNSTGPHLHFEIRVFERMVNPQDILEL